MMQNPASSIENQRPGYYNYRCQAQDHQVKLFQQKITFCLQNQIGRFGPGNVNQWGMSINVE
jgi:hypothetical protein